MTAFAAAIEVAGGHHDLAAPRIVTQIHSKNGLTKAPPGLSLAGIDQKLDAGVGL